MHFGNFAEAWDEGNFSTYLRSSVIVAVVVVVGLDGALDPRPATRSGLMRFRGSKRLFYVFLLGLMVPLEAIVVPLYYDLRALGLTDTYWALILPQIAALGRVRDFWMRAFFRSAPRSLIEAARIDGASSWSTLWRVLRAASAAPRS